jgi:hypothetical protein
MHRTPIPSILPLSLLIALIPFGGVSARSINMSEPDPDLPRAVLVGFRDTSGENRLPSRLQRDLQSELEGTGKWRLQTGSGVDSTLRRIARSDSDCTDSCMESLGRSLDVRILFVPHLTSADGATHLTLMEIHLDSQLVMDRADAELGEPQAGTIERLAQLVVERIADQSPGTDSESGPAPGGGYGSSAIRVETFPTHEVWIDGNDVGTGPLTLETWPGEHRVSVVPPPRADPDAAPPRSSDFECAPVVSFGFLWVQPMHGGYRERNWHPQASGGRTMRSGSSGPIRSERPSHHGGGHYGDDAGVIVAGAAVAAIGIGLLAASASQPDSVWDHTYQDVVVRARDTVQVTFQRTSTGNEGLKVLGVLALVFGLVLIVAVASSQH